MNFHVCYYKEKDVYVLEFGMASMVGNVDAVVLHMACVGYRQVRVRR